MKYLIWDFDGTLGTRPGGWSGMLAEMLRDATGLAVTAEDMRPYTAGGYTWSNPERPHVELNTSEKWWDTLHDGFVQAFRANGADELLAVRLARQVREVYPQAGRFRLYEDTLATLDALAEQGWIHLILSNHVPEFRRIAAALDLTHRMRHIFNSAETGYEKPHPEAYRLALEAIPDAETIWMIGDNPVADVQGAEAAGIPAILVRTPCKGVARFSPDLAGVAGFLS
ncbi:MAG: HAD family hydrolase [Chloroflexota bacterium]